MTRKRKTLWLALGLAIATVAAAAAVPRGQGAWGAGWTGDHPPMERFHEERMERMSGFLDLDAQQTEQWRQAFASRAETRGADFEALRGLHEQIREAAAAARPDPEAVGELVIEAHRRMEAVKAEREAFHAQLLSILTPEQQERFEALQELRPERGRRGARGPGREHRWGSRPERSGPAD